MLIHYNPRCGQLTATVLSCFLAHATISEHVPLLKYRRTEVNCTIVAPAFFNYFSKSGFSATGTCIKKSDYTSDYKSDYIYMYSPPGFTMQPQNLASTFPNKVNAFLLLFQTNSRTCTYQPKCFHKYLLSDSCVCVYIPLDFLHFLEKKNDRNLNLETENGQGTIHYTCINWRQRTHRQNLVLHEI